MLDIFNGAATTGMVSLKNGRKYVGIELNPEYVKLSKDRLDEDFYNPNWIIGGGDNEKECENGERACQNGERISWIQGKF